MNYTVSWFPDFKPYLRVEPITHYNSAYFIYGILRRTQHANIANDFHPCTFVTNQCGQ